MLEFVASYRYRQLKEFREEEVMEDLNSYHTHDFLEPHGPEMWRQVSCEIFDTKKNNIVKMGDIFCEILTQKCNILC